MSVESGSSTVLIIEDDPDINELYEFALSRPGSGFDPVIRETPTAGLAYFEANQDTHLVILDRDLPEMFGEVVAERIRQISGKPEDPFILMISGRGRGQLDMHSLHAKGVNKLLVKPFSPKEIIAELTAANQRFQSPRS